MKYTSSAERCLEGIVKLPHPLLVDEGVLGGRFAFSLSDGDGELFFPVLPQNAADGDWYVLQCPLPDVSRLVEIVGDEGWGCANNEKYLDYPRPLASLVKTVAFRALVNTDPSIAPHDYARHYGRQFNTWLEIVEQWIELWTPLILSPPTSTRAPLASRGQFWDSSTEPEQLTGWGLSGGNVVAQWATDALNATTLSAAMRRAPVGEAPPTEWVLLLRARRLDEPRLAVIEASAAAEVALARTLRRRLSGLSDAARERIIVDANGLVELLRLLEDIDQVQNSRWKRVADRLANPRNLAVHAGEIPKDVASAITEAASLLDLYAPLESP